MRAVVSPLSRALVRSSALWISGVSCALRGRGAKMAELRDRHIGGDEDGGELGLDDSQPRSPRPRRPPRKWRRRVENVYWLGTTAFALYYGDSHANFFAVLYSNPRIIRTPLYVGFCLVVIILIFFYRAVWLRHVIRTNSDCDILGAIPAATILSVSAFFMFSFALWPVWGFLTIPLLITLCMSVIPFGRTVACEPILSVDLFDVIISRQSRITDQRRIV